MAQDIPDWTAANPRDLPTLPGAIQIPYNTNAVTGPTTITLPNGTRALMVFVTGPLAGAGSISNLKLQISGQTVRWFDGQVGTGAAGVPNVPFPIEVDWRVSTTVDVTITTTGCANCAGTLWLLPLADLALLSVVTPGTWPVQIQDSGRLAINLGQRAMAASLPVTMASDQPATDILDRAARLVGHVSVDSVAVALDVSDRAARLLGHAQLDSGGTLAGQKAMAASVPVVLASDQVGPGGSAQGVRVLTPDYDGTGQNNPAAGTRPTVSLAANATQRWRCHAYSGEIANGSGAALSGQYLVLRDGASQVGLGTAILCAHQVYFPALAGNGVGWTRSGLAYRGTVNTAMTIEITAVGAANLGSVGIGAHLAV